MSESAFDHALVREILRQIHWSTQTILKRFAPVRSPNDFLDSDQGLEKLDSICMQFIALGESLKNLDKVTAGQLLPRYPQIDWKKVHGDARCHLSSLLRSKCRDHLQYL